MIVDLAVLDYVVVVRQRALDHALVLVLEPVQMLAQPGVPTIAQVVATRVVPVVAEIVGELVSHVDTVQVVVMTIAQMVVQVVAPDRQVDV